MTEEELFKVYIKRELCAHCGFPQFCKACSDIATAKRHYLAGVEAGKSQAETDLATIAYKQGAEFGYNKAFVEADKNLKAIVTDFNKASEWHKVADGDLAKDTRFVWTNVGAGCHDGDGWYDDFGRLDGVIAWCEPKFEE